RPHLVSNVHGDLIVEPWGRAKTGCAVVSPESSNFRLLGSSRSRRDNSIAAEALYFVISGGVFGAVQRGRRRTTELGRRGHHERLHLAPQRTESERMPADWILAPHSRRVAGDEFDSDAGLGVGGTVVSAKRKHLGG